jgi:hypothetical protein
MEVGQGPNWGCSAKEKNWAWVTMRDNTLHASVAVMSLKLFYDTQGKLGNTSQNC